MTKAENETSRYKRERDEALAEVARLKEVVGAHDSLRPDCDHDYSGDEFYSTTSRYCPICCWTEDEAHRADLTSAVCQLRAALQWYVDNDETNESPDNETWLAGKKRAMDLLAKGEPWMKGEDE